MNSPALAFIWEIWWKNRWGNWAVLAAIPFCALTAWGAARWFPPFNPADAAPVTIFPLVASLLWVFYVFAHTEGDARRGFSGIPVRLFTLPVRTSRLVACLMLSGIAAVVGVFLLWHLLVLRPLGIRLPLPWTLLVLATGLAGFQTAVWGLASFPWIRGGIIGVGGFVLIAASALPFSDDLDMRHYEPALRFALLAALPLAYGLAVVSVGAERRGGWDAWRWLRTFAAKIIAFLPRRQTAFASPGQAQFWFEWRRKGFFFAAGLAVLVAGSISLLPVGAMLDPDTSLPLPAFFLGSIFYPLFLAGLLGGGLAKSDFWAREVALNSFHALRPLPTVELVHAKLKAATVITLLGWFLAALLTLALTRLTHWREMWDMSGLSGRIAAWLPAEKPTAFLLGATLLLTAVAITWKGMIESLCLGLTGQRRTILIRSHIGIAILMATIFAGTWLWRHPAALEHVLPWLHALIAGVMLLKIYETLRTFKAVCQRGLLPRPTLRLYWALWLTLGGLLAGAACLLWFTTSTSRPLILFVTAWLWPAGELAQCTTHLTANRHR